MKPKFKVGEEVVLQSKTHPQYNGEYVVERVLYQGQKFICRSTGNVGTVRVDVGYLLNEIFMEEDSYAESRVEESELRKKYKPSDKSFDELIGEINKMVKA